MERLVASKYFATARGFFKTPSLSLETKLISLFTDWTCDSKPTLSKPTLRDHASFVIALKERARFTLRKNDYDNLITTLNEGNETLRVLVSQSKDLEPFRKSLVRVSYIKMFQRLTQGIHTSLEASISCKCTGVHGLALELNCFSRKASLIRADDASTSPFGIAFGSN